MIGAFGIGGFGSAEFALAARRAGAGGVYDKTASVAVNMATEESGQMHTAVHPPLAAKTGEPVEITFTVTDKDGAPVDISAGEAVYRVGRRAGEATILEVLAPDGIMLASNTALVIFDTDDIADADGPLLGDFLGQLTVTLDGAGLVVAEGVLSISPKLQALP